MRRVGSSEFQRWLDSFHKQRWGLFPYCRNKEVELDGRPLPVTNIEEAYIGLSEVGYEANPKTAGDTVLKVARERRYHPVQRYFEGLEQDESIRPIDLLGELLRDFRPAV